MPRFLSEITFVVIVRLLKRSPFCSTTVFLKGGKRIRDRLGYLRGESVDENPIHAV